MRFFKYIQFLSFSILLLSLGACNLQKEIEIDLDDYQSQPFVECYLIPGQPFNLLLSNANSYFEPFDTGIAFVTGQLLSEATIVITHNGVDYPLTNTLGFLPETGRIYNYVNTQLVPNDYNSTFTLSIILKDGRTIAAETSILQPVPIDSVVVEFLNDDTLARALTYINDDPTIDNYYRRQLNFGADMDSLMQDFILDDRLIDNSTIAFGSGPEFAVGDTIFNTIWHFARPYYEFKRSVDNAVAGSTNPFSQPGQLVSNVTGTANAIGIFAGLSYDRVRSIIE